MPREKTIHVGVYVRSVKNRIGPSGELDKCFDIHYKLNGKDIWERVGWESEGFTVEDAVAIRKKRIEELRRPVSGSYKSGRVKTKYVGVYVRQARNRLDATGKPDKGYDIHYKHNGKDIWERVGWKSEGYSVQDAIAVRAQRIRAIRHPELAAVDAGITLLQLWIKYAETWLPQQKSADNSISVINKHLISHLGNIPVNKITPLDVEILKNKLLKDLKPGTVKLILKKLRAIINKGKEWNLVKKELIFSRTCFNVPNAEVKRDKYLEPKEAERILDGLQFYDYMLYYIAKFALYTGMRLGDIVNLKSKDINIKAKLIYVDGKTGHRVAYIPDEILGDIQKLMNNNGEKNIFEISR